MKPPQENCDHCWHARSDIPRELRNVIGIQATQWCCKCDGTRPWEPEPQDAA